MNKPGNQRIILLLLITPVLLVVQLVLGIIAFRSIQSASKTESRNNKLDLYLRTNTKYLSHGESSLRGLLLTGNKKFRDDLSVDLNEIRKTRDIFDTLEDELKSSAVLNIEMVSHQKFAIMERTVMLYDAGEKDSALTVVKTEVGALLMDSIRAASAAIRNDITSQATGEKEREKRLFGTFFGLIAVLIAFDLFLAWYTYRQFLDYTRNLEKMVASLRDANERMGQYTAMSYHELKTPLRNIGGFAQLLKRKYSSSDPGSEENQFIQFITEGIRQMNQTINEMRGKYLDDADDKENSGG